MRLAFFIFLALISSIAHAADAPAASDGPAASDARPPIPVRFHLDRPGLVTLVIEDERGMRVRNLSSAEPFPAGENVVWWDGLDDLGRDTDAAAHGVFHIPGRLVQPGTYRVRGIVHDPLDVRYELTPYFPGDPPWMTADRSSGWLANHSPPSGVCFIPAGEAPLRKGQEGMSPAQMIVGSHVSEGGSGIAWIGLDGRKLHGQEWLGGVWTGAEFIARDVGPNPVEEYYAYTAAYWEGDKFNNHQSELRLHALRRVVDRTKAPRDGRFGTGEDRAILRPTYKVEVRPENQSRPRLGGLAVYNGLLVVSIPANDQLLLVDVRKQAVIGTADLPGVSGIAFDPAGRLYALADRRLLRFASIASTKLPAPQVIVRDQLEEPRQIALADDGAIYISDWGDAHQVKVFGADGRLIRTIGEPGKPVVGPYNPMKMHRPLGIALAPENRLWVAENDHLPKRLSIWSRDGRLIQAFYGPPPYGSGGTLDPLDKSRFFLANRGGMELRLDWSTGQSAPVAIYDRPGDDPLRALRGDQFTSPQTPIHRDGRTYLVDSYNVSPTQGVQVSGAWLLEAGRIKPVALVGQANELVSFNPARGFSARWVGQVRPETSETYTFYSFSSHGTRLWVDGKTITRNWHNWGGETKGTIELQAGKRYDIVFEMYHRDGPARATLAWSTPTIKKQPIPTRCLFPPDAPQAAAGTGLLGSYFSDRNLKDLVETRLDAKVDFNWGKAGLNLAGANAFRQRLPAGADLEKQRWLFAWSDFNDNGRPEPEEVTTAPCNAISINFQADLSVLTGSGLLLRPRRFTSGGAPVYDAADFTPVLPPGQAQGPVSSGGGQALIDSRQQAAGGRQVQNNQTQSNEISTFIMTTAPKPFAPQSIGGGRGGVATWSYPSLWPGLHASHIAPPAAERGQLIGTTRLLGLPIAPAGPEVGPLFALNGNKGVVYLFTMDGLFVDQLFNDIRTASWNAPRAERGMSVKNLSLHEETFYTSITQTADGEVYLQGLGHVMRVEGLKTLRRLPAFELTVDGRQLAEAQRYFIERETARQREADAPAIATIPIVATAGKVDGRLDDWADAQWLTIDQRTVQVGDWGKRKVKTEAAVRIAGDRLLVALKTDQPELLRNAGDVLQNLFKTGGGIDLMIGAVGADPDRPAAVAGDQRLLVAQVEGRIVAMRYRPVAPGTSTEPVLFSSPVRSVRIDRVDEVSEGVELATTVEREGQAVKEARFELSIPLATLDLRPRDGLRIRADIGVLRGNGFQTHQRVYWSNKATGLVSDLPSEAELLPRLWGTWIFADTRN